MEALSKEITSNGLINMVDITAVIVFALCFFSGLRKGLIRMTFDLVGFAASLYLANRLYPFVSAYLRKNTNLYIFIKGQLMESLNIERAVNEYIQAGERAVFESLPVPEFFIDLLSESNIPSVHEMLDVSGLADYIGGFLSNMVINGISCVLVFMSVFVIMRIIAAVLDIFSKLPVIKTFNRLGGALMGAVTGALAVWVLLAVTSVLFVGAVPEGESLILNSFIGRYFYANDLLITGMTGIY